MTDYYKIAQNFTPKSKQYQNSQLKEDKTDDSLRQIDSKSIEKMQLSFNAQLKNCPKTN